MLAKFKTLVAYAVILAAGLGVGLAMAKAPALFKKDFVEGDYTAYLQQHQSKVVLYGTPSCPYCAKAREHLRKNGIAFADVNVDQPGQAQDEFKRLNGAGVPLILIGKRRIEGYLPDAIDQALKLAAR